MENGRIPFNRAALVGTELSYIEQAVAGWHISGDGPFSKKCQALLESALGVHKALLTTSCTHALEMAALLLNLKAEDEVTVPAFVSVSTMNTSVLCGARPALPGIRPEILVVKHSKTRRGKSIVQMLRASLGGEQVLMDRSRPRESSDHRFS